MIPFPIDPEDVILEKKVPSGTTGKVAIINYHGKSLVVPIEMYDSGKYRIEFIKTFGFPPPQRIGEVSELFSPNIQEFIE